MIYDAMMSQTFISIVTSLLLYSTSVYSSVTCPHRCSCTSTTLKCHDGFTMDSLTFRDLSKDIKSINITNCLIRELTVKHLQWFPRLSLLYLVESRVRDIDENSFNQSPVLEVINLSSNRIVNIPSKLFKNQVKLTALSLADNLIENLPETIFQNITLVRELILSENLIRFLPAKLFNGLVNLHRLELSGNELSYILPSMFSYMSSVRFIGLSDNQLVTLHEDLFASNNVTVLTNLTMGINPLDCNCGLVWLKRAVKGDFSHINLLDANDVVCENPAVYHNKLLSRVPLEQLNCTQPIAYVRDNTGSLPFHANKVELECYVEGSPHPSVVWQTPMMDLISDALQGAWIDGSIGYTYPERKYQIYATGETMHFTVKSFPRYSRLSVDSLHIVASGLYKCIAINPGGNATASISVTMVSPIEQYYLRSLFIGVCTILIAMCLGVVGCSVTACVEKCLCCEPMSIKYYDGAWMNCRNFVTRNNNAEDISLSETGDSEDSDGDSHEDEELLGAMAGSTSFDTEPSTSTSSLLHSQFGASEINDQTALTAEEWDAYFREYPDDFVVESFAASPKKSPRGSPRGSPVHRPHGKTLETLDAVRVRLKLRVEQIDVMKERLRIRMEKRSARMKENMERRKVRMNKRMQTIKESTSQSLQSIRETGRNYSHKLHMGVRTAMENVGAQVQSLKEFCGTGDLGQTLSIATITTDIDTNEKTEIARSVTMV